MKIEIKNVKINQALSDETVCYSATVYVNGQRAFIASNRGCGGSDDYHPIDVLGKRLLNEAEAWARTLPPLDYDGFSLPASLETVIGDLVARHEKERDTMRLLSKNTIVKDGDAWRQFRAPFSEVLAQRIKRERPNAIIVNVLPLSEAIALLETV